MTPEPEKDPTDAQPDPLVELYDYMEEDWSDRMISCLRRVNARRRAGGGEAPPEDQDRRQHDDEA